MNKKIIFIDLDGTLIDTHSGETFPKGVWDMNIKWDAWKALKSFVKENDTEFVCIITNQGGIESGHVNKFNWLDKFRYIKSALQEYLNNGKTKEVLDVDVCGEYCASNDKENSDRKPNTGMLSHFLAVNTGWYDLTGVPKSEMIMIGDASGKPNDFSDTDKKTAENFGIEYMDIDDIIMNFYDL